MMNPHTVWKLRQKRLEEALESMAAQTGILIQSIPLDDPAVFRLLCADAPETSPKGIPALDSDHARVYLKKIQPQDFGQLTRVIAFCSGSFCSKEDNQKMERFSGQSLFCTREDVTEYLLNRGLGEADAFAIAEFVRKGLATRRDKVEWLYQFDLPEEFYDAVCQIWYLPQRAAAVSTTATAYRLYWFKVHHPQVFRSGMRSTGIVTSED